MKSFFPFFRKKQSTQVVSETDFFVTLRSSGLSDQEKRIMRKELQQMIARTSEEQLATPFGNILPLKRTWLAATLILLVLLPGSWGVVRASESALPGEILYFFKIQVNEPTVSLWRSAQDDSAQWERERAKRRVREAEELAQKGQLTEEKKAVIGTLIGKHRAALKQYSEETDDEFVEEINRGTGRLKIVTEKKENGNSYRLRENMNEERRSGEEQEKRSGHKREDAEDSESSESLEDFSHQEGKKQEDSESMHESTQRVNPSSVRTRSSSGKSNTSDDKTDDEDALSEEGDTEGDDSVEKSEDKSGRSDNDDDDDDEEKDENDEKSDHSGKNN